MDEPQYPTPSSLPLLGRDLASPAQTRGIVAHMLSQYSIVETRRAPVGTGRRRALEKALPEGAYSQAVEQAAEAARQRAADLAREAEAIRGFAELLAAQPPARQLLLLRNSQRGRTSLLCSDLLAESSAVRSENPRRRLELTELAFQTAEGLEEGRYGACVVADLRSRAAAELADAWRGAGRVDLAAELMQGAFDLVAQGSGDPLLKARLYELAATLLRQCGQLDLATGLLDRSYRIYLRLGEDDLAGRILLQRAVTEGHRAAPAACIELLLQAVELLDLDSDRELAWATIHNLLWALTELGRFEAAAELLAECRRSLADCPSRLLMQRLTWLEGRIAAGIGREVDAEVKLLEAGRGMGRAGHHQEACLALMDLAALLGRQGRIAEVRVLVEEVLATHRRLAPEREAIVALLALREALERPRVPSGLIEQVQVLLRRSAAEPCVWPDSLVG